MSETKPIEGITLKELAPYLPYGLKYISHCESVLNLDWEHVHYLINTKGKPILRNLSDLTKEIEVNGERFVPNEWLSENMPNTPNFRYMLNASHHFDLSETIIEWCVMNKLIEWHFDVFDLRSKNLCIYFDEFKNGLIDRGLAVNINDIQK